MAKVFICYAEEDFEAAERMYNELLQIRQDPWMDKKSIVPGQKWEPTIREAIRTSDYFLAILSPHSVGKRGYVQKELRLGLEALDQFPDTEIFLIPVRIAPCDPSHLRLKEIQYVDMFPEWNAGVRQIIKVFAFSEPPQIDQDLPGSQWRSTETLHDLGEWTFLLRADGVVEYEQNDAKRENGRWRQEGEGIYMQFNDRFVQYRGTIRKGRMVGDAQNLKGEIWTWEATRID